MTSRSFLLSARSAPALTLVLAGALGCGGNVSVSNGGNGGDGGGNGGGNTTTTGTGGNTLTTGTGGNTTTTITTNTTQGCEALDHISCLGAHPSCVPVYDDKCCPTCDPMGGCADCIDIQFHHCAPYADQCAGAPSKCGQTPGWACDGGQATCPADPGGSPSPCGTTAGCLPAYCALNLESCPAEPVCHPATKGTCMTQCDSVPPPCPGGTYAESDGFCYTQYCVPENVCVIGL